MSDALDTRSPTKSSCPDDESIAAFVAGEQSSDEKSELEAHFAECQACRRVLSALAPDVGTSESSDSAGDPAAGEGAGLARGQVIDGKYTIETLLGAGGMGVLAQARHRVLNTSVVIKLLRAPEVDEETLQRFLREARAGAALDSAFVARVLDAGILDNGRPYLVLEHLQGSDFAALLQRDGPLRPADAVLYVLQAAEALAVAHSHGIVHRDIKPANLFLADSTDGGRMLKVLDFGIAKAAEDSGIDQASRTLTGTAAVMGSPRYMSPEQLEHTAGVDARTDVWSLGAVLYELLSGAPAFDAANLAGLAAAILTREPRPLRELREDVPSRLAAVVARCLRKQRGERFQSMAELAGALAPFAPAEGSSLVERIRRISEKSHSSVMPPSRELPASRRLKWYWLVLAGVGVAIVLVFASSPRSAPPALERGLANRSPLSVAPALSVAPPGMVSASASVVEEPSAADTRGVARAAPRSSVPVTPSSGSLSDIHRPGLGDRK
jgi:eukaryotic-like serine/threonine-protein kinase